MPVEIDHIILAVNDRVKSLDFYTRLLGFEYRGDDGPFSIVRISAGSVVLFAENPTPGGEHVAFAMSKDEFEAAFSRIIADGIPYGDRFDAAQNMRGPADESGARGMGKALYVLDPNRHLIELRYYA